MRVESVPAPNRSGTKSTDHNTARRARCSRRSASPCAHASGLKPNHVSIFGGTSGTSGSSAYDAGGRSRRSTARATAPPSRYRVTTCVPPCSAVSGCATTRTSAPRATRKSRSASAGPSANPLATIACMSGRCDGEVVREQRVERRDAFQRVLDGVLQRRETVERRRVMRLEHAEAHRLERAADELVEAGPGEVLVPERLCHVHVEERVVAVRLDDERHTARLEHAAVLGERTGGIVHVVKRVFRVDDVEAGLLERQRL